MQGFNLLVRNLAGLLIIGLLVGSGSVDGGNVHVIIAADTTQEAGLGGDVEMDQKNIEDLFRRQVPAGQLTVKVLQDPLSPDSILNAVKDLPIARRRDSVVFYYTGHGAFDTTKGHFFSLPNRQELLRSQLQQALIKRDPRTAVIISDCCAAGARFVGKPKAMYAAVKVQKISPLLDHLLFQRSGIIDITSSAPDEVSLTRGDGKGSLFTYPFVNYLKNNANNVIGWEKIVSDLKRQVQEDFDLITKNKGVDTTGDRIPDQFKQTVHTFVVTPRLGMRIQLKNGNLVITQVLPLSPAFHAGLEAGDYLRAINGQDLNTERDYDRAVDNSPVTMLMKVHDPRQGITEMRTAILNP